jgi:hypothetical protein
MQILAGVGSSETLPTPTLSTTSNDVGAFTVSITNYDATYSYVLSPSAGSASRSTSNITVSGLANSQSSTLTVYATKAGFNNSANAVITSSAIPACTYTGYSYNTIAGGNCSTCGIICCGSGVPAYDITYYQYTPYPCNLGGVKRTGDVGVVGSWYCLTTGTGSGLSCGPATICGGSNGC